MNNKYQKFFPIFKNSKLIYLDNAATTQICKPSLDAMNDYYLKYRANVHRSSYKFAEKSTEEFENARKIIANFINADQHEIIFTSGTTQGINLICSSLTPRFGPRDNVVISKLEHHSNLVPWQEAARHYGFELRFIEIDSNFELDLESANKLIDKNTKFVSVSLASNVLGAINPVKKIFKFAKKFNSLTLVDAAQAIAHIPIDVKDLDSDFLVFSGHKAYGPSGIGVLYGKKILLNESLEPFIFGGDMVKSVSLNRSTWADLPNKFEAGTPNIAGAIGLGAALEFINSLGWKNIISYENRNTEYLLKKISPLVEIFGNKNFTNRLGVVAFNMGPIHPHDVNEIINRHDIAVRSGLHCAEPLHREFNLVGSIRASLAIYNSKKDIDDLVGALKEAKRIFKI